MFRSTTLFVLMCLVAMSQAFVAPHAVHVTRPVATTTTSTTAFVFGKKPEPEDDLSFIETRDMTREEMQRYNAATEKVMNQELWGMTVFSLVISLPMFYLVWVGFFAETTEFGL
uniref:Transmembrane protein n=1 Tax=Entomoneis paludosa TaxID=265537 RepID=A0A7S2YCW3_9STRA|mmetsp:Transcript_27811/g.58228  ORF Transcript_27811/g.58228 Transcript_27811/m.58228 type:complete len:114 (+) Transcript_27811:116-457(+)